MQVGTDAHGRIARWMDRLTEYDHIVRHRPSKANITGLADGVLRSAGVRAISHILPNIDRRLLRIHGFLLGLPASPSLPR